MYVDLNTQFKIRNKVTGEIKTAYQGHKSWLIVDEKGNEIMADWEVFEDKSIINPPVILAWIILVTSVIYILAM